MFLSVVSKNKQVKLEQQLEEKAFEVAFETAHTLKGMYANLSLTPLTEPVSEMTELLRKRTDTDYSELMEEAKTQFAKLRSL